METTIKICADEIWTNLTDEEFEAKLEQLGSAVDDEMYIHVDIELYGWTNGGYEAHLQEDRLSLDSVVSVHNLDDHELFLEIEQWIEDNAHKIYIDLD
jgi:hypothetical protein